MRKRLLGRTGVEVCPLALGGHEYLPDGRSRGFNEHMALAVTPGHIGSGYGGTKRRAVLGAAYELGIDVFDVTIDSEKEALGRNLREMPPPYPVLVQTRPEGMCYSYDRDNRKLLDLRLLRAEVQRSLLLLQRECIDLFNVGLLAWSIDNHAGYLAELAHNLATLKREGLIRWAVADSFSGERLYLAMLDSGAFDAVNLDLNVGDTGGLSRVVPSARQLGLGVVAREVFLKSALFRIGEQAGIDDKALLACAAMQWVAMQAPDCLIVGVDDAAQLRANARAWDAAPDEAAAQLLEDLRATPAFLDYAARKDAEFFETDKTP